MKFIELQVYMGFGDKALCKNESVNPEYIVSIEDDGSGSHAYVHLLNKAVLHTVQSREDILNLIMLSNLPSPKYIQ